MSAFERSIRCWDSSGVPSRNPRVLTQGVALLADDIRAVEGRVYRHKPDRRSKRRCAFDKRFFWRGYRGSQNSMHFFFERYSVTFGAVPQNGGDMFVEVANYQVGHGASICRDPRGVKSGEPNRSPVGFALDGAAAVFALAQRSN